ncbi:phosphoesterase [Robertkochia marina]|uniref:Phosphoesterase n=1 Tax=Robertkochia marina TaxID=1227945 RepID=A0A4S3M689_9FLAO|nr:metallophosphoesterase [Robertkochia marina]THD69737.1 phosphoesterase [Robertkochia marina]TRZ46919.1 phosphoesterase [Robertkochia marina]
MTQGRSFLLAVLFLAFFSCATYEAQVRKNQEPFSNKEKELSTRFFLLGDAGNSKQGEVTPGISAFKTAVESGNESDIALILGDNIYEKGLLPKSHPDRSLSEHRIAAQLDALKNFKGRAVVIPGNHDWYDDGLKSLERQQDFIKDYLDKKDVFLPEDGCGLTEVAINDKTHLIVIDSQWYLEDWDEHPTMNDDCDIKTRKRFFIEFESMLKKQEGKTVIIAIHHPIDTYGSHGGYFAAEKHLFPFQKKIPLPGIASLIALVRQNGGVSTQDLQNTYYRDFTNRIKTMLREAPVKAVFVSGHEHTLQYIDGGFYKQVVSGSGSKTSAARLTNDAVFTYGKQGFAVLEVYKDGSSTVRYYTAENTDIPIFTGNVYAADPVIKASFYPENFPDSISASIYEKDAYEVSGVHKSVWGEHYRELYGIRIKAPTVNLDTLYGGLTPIRMGGGHQSKTLRFQDAAGREYNMRALKKSGVKFLQTVVLNDKNLSSEDLTGTLPDKLLMDFFTAAHPYAAFVIPDLSKAAGVYHTNPKLFYIPRQEALGKYNTDYGDELYMIEERPNDAHSDNKSFGLPDQIESTDKLFKELREDEENRLDEGSYLRARLFDMLIGDWDRHGDQWRWAEFHHDGGKTYRPIPRDRDQAFSDFDGALLSTARTLAAPTRMVQRYEPELKNIEWFNVEPLPMDRVLIQNSTRAAYLKEARHLKASLTDDKIEDAFLNLPSELYDHSSTVEIKSILKKRRDLLETIAADYYQLLSELVILHGTDKDDLIEVERLKEGATAISIRRIKDGRAATTLVNRTYYPRETKEIWIYALDDDDVIEVKGKEKATIDIKIIGGQNNDIYRIENGEKVHLYDHKSKPNTIEFNSGASKRFTDSYQLNHFDFNKNITKSPSFYPVLGFNPDAGFIAGAGYNLLKMGFNRNPFSSQHRLSAFYHFATKGVEFNYDGEFAGVFNHMNLITGVRLTNSTFTRNFFGFGSNTINDGENLGFDYYRVNMSTMNGYVGVAKRSEYGSLWETFMSVEAFEVEENKDRFISDFNTDPKLYDWKTYLSLATDYQFENYDFPVNPRRGMLFRFQTGYMLNLRETSKGVLFMKPQLQMYQNITADKKLVLKTNISGHLNIANDLEFFQGAYLGGNSGLRGYRLNRFTGRNSLVFNGDLRYNFNEFKTGILPMQIGVYGGYDLGRVWHPQDPFNQWQNSFGGGLYIVASRLLFLDLSLFASDEDTRFGFRFGVNF